jgi:hypothetical protein
MQIQGLCIAQLIASPKFRSGTKLIAAAHEQIFSGIILNWARYGPGGKTKSTKFRNL